MKLADRMKGWRVKAAARWQKLGKRRGVWIAAGAVALIALGAVLTTQTDTGTELVDSVREQVGAKPSLAELKQRVSEDPKDAGAHTRLGRALFEGGFRGSGLQAYDRALELDPAQADEGMLKDLVSCYGAKEQSRAHAVLVEHKLAQAERYLDDLTRSPRWLVRTGAIQTLEKLGKVTRDDYLNLWLTDLKTAEDCKVRQYAVVKLGELGDKRALEAIRQVRKVEDETTPWFTAKCVGDKAKDAEQRILASR